jgi:prolyl oligopeptidase PreP (S9A serine peptidase family)
MLVEKIRRFARKIGLYGGSYGGFITLMAMFNHPKHLPPVQRSVRLPTGHITTTVIHPTF